MGISIHALREEGDPVPYLPERRVPGISIHALREEGDFVPSRLILLVKPFLSTPSARRATIMLHPGTFWISTFLSTPSARRATAFRG